MDSSSNSPSISSFPPVVAAGVHTLILGSMPGRLSLSHNQYYAHPRNSFWHIMGELFDADLNLPYKRRLTVLLENGIGLWDVIGSCSRKTSLDSDIEEDSIQVNNFRMLLEEYPTISRIFFNGSKAEQAFRRYVVPDLPDSYTTIEYQRLVSTSPANARYSYADKVKAWTAALL